MAVRLNLGNVNEVFFVNNRRIPVQSRPYFFGQHLTKSKDDAALLFVYLVNTGRRIEAKRQNHK